MLDNLVNLHLHQDAVEFNVDNPEWLEPATRVQMVSRQNGRVEFAFIYLSERQLRALHAKIGARLAEIDAALERPVVVEAGEEWEPDVPTAR